MEPDIAHHHLSEGLILVGHNFPNFQDFKRQLLWWVVLGDSNLLPKA